MIVHPGPNRIGSGECPGGIVLHVYSVPEERLLIVQRVTFDHVERLAVEAAEEVDRLGLDRVCLVAYDGDSGERMKLAPYHPLTVEDRPNSEDSDLD